jgi:hypothetical protein
MGRYGNKCFHTWHERHCEAKIPVLEQQPDGEKKPGLGIPQPGDKVKAAVCRLKFAKNYLLKDVTFFAACVNFPVPRGYPKRGFVRAKHVLSKIEGTPRMQSNFS